MYEAKSTDRLGTAIGDAYQRGVAHGRRTCEEEFEAERHALATLVNSLSEAVSELTLHLNPDDMAQLGDTAFDIRIRPDRLTALGAVRLTGRAA